MNVPKYYAACFGKSTIATNDPDVALIKNISSTLVERGIAVVHGGYSGGAMGAVDEGAVNTAAKLNAPFPEIWSVGVTVDCFSEGYGLTTNGLSFPTRTVEERLAAMDQLANMYVVLPRGGLGTAHELVHFLSKNAYFVEPKKPLVLFGEHWKSLIQSLLACCDTEDTIETFPWIYVVNSIAEFRSAVDSILDSSLSTT